MMKWEKIGRTVHSDGSTEIRYICDDAFPYVVESHKRPIPHTQRGGSWMHTSYFVIDTASGYEKEFWRLSDAQEAAEKLAAEGN